MMHRLARLICRRHRRSFTVTIMSLGVLGLLAHGASPPDTSNANPSGTTASVTRAVYLRIERIEITPAAPSVDAADSIQLTATAYDAEGVEIAIPPDAFAWRSANHDIAMVSPASGSARGVVAGATKIILTETHTGHRAVAELTVNPVISHVVVSPENPSVAVCGARQLTATAIDEQGHVVPSANSFQWQTSHRGIVNISSGGLATGVTTGAAEITVTETTTGKRARVIINSLATTSRVLEFDGSPKTVDYYVFWEPGINLGHFFWEFWAAPVGLDAGATYLLSDGYGGAHALLFGFAAYGTSEPGRYQLFGNIWDGVSVIYFGSDEGPAPDEWGHFAVGWDGQNIVTYLNGIPVGAAPFAGPRRTPGFAGGGGRALVGGSDHNNLVGRIAQLRGYEGSNPLARGGGSTLASFAPQTLLRDGGNVTSNFFCEGNPVADLSEGHQGSFHAGRLRGTLAPYGILGECPDCPLPQYVVDPTAPQFLDETGSNAAPSPAPSKVAPPAAPIGALAFDSFSRSNSTYAFDAKGGLGSTESGAATGAHLWRTSVAANGPQPFGLLNGRAVPLTDAAALAWVPTGSTNGDLDVRVSRRPGARGSGISTALSFRVVDAANYFFAYTTGDGIYSSTAQKLHVGYYLNGERTDLASGVVMPSQWTMLRVVTTGSGKLTVYADATPLYSTVNDLSASATGAGVYNNARGLGLANRWDDFTVYPAR